MINTRAIINRMTETNVTEESLAAALKMPVDRLIEKVLGASPLTLIQADAMQAALAIPDQDFGEYFFYHA